MQPKFPEYRKLIDEAIAWARGQSSDREQQIADAADKLVVNIGLEILKLVPGRISTEVDARLSYDTDASVAKAKRLTAVQRSRHQQRSHSDQTGSDLAGHPRGGAVGERRHQL